MTKIIAVIAANGRTGQAFVHMALSAGHTVRAGYNGVNNLPDHKNLVAVKCDATYEMDVRELLNGADVVVSLIGHIKGSPANVQTDAMKVIVKVMNELRIVRLISLTGTGVRFPGDRPGLLDRFLNISIKLIDPRRISDGINHARYIESSMLEWTIIRVLKLTNGKSSGRVKFSLTGPAELFTPRERVAKGILQIITEDTYVRKAPIVQGEE